MLIVSDKYCSLKNIFEIKNRRKLSDLLEDLYVKTTDKAATFPKTYKPLEILRASFGDDLDLFEDTVVNLIKSALNLSSKDFTTEVTHNTNVSGKFPVCQITFNKDIGSYDIKNGDVLYITNRTTVVADKQLSPQSLGIVGTFSKSALMKKINKSLDESQLPESLKTSLRYICEQISSNTDKKIDVNDLMLKGAKQVLNYSLPSKKIDLDEFKKSLNAIAKDFGEIIGGVFLLSYMDGANQIVYSDSFTEPMIDYQIITKDNSVLGVSAKISTGGHIPSSSTVLSKLKNYVTSDMEIDGISFDEMLREKYIDKPDSIKDAKELFEILVRTNEGSTKNQYITLINTFCSNNKTVKDFCKLFDLSNFYSLITEFGDRTLEKNFGKKFDALCQNKSSFKKVYDLYSNIESNCGFKSTIKFSTPDEAIGLTDIQKIGMFVYPLSQLMVKTINDNFGLDKKNKNKIDIISAFVRLAFSHKQIYTKIQLSADNSVTITFSFAAMDTGDWQFKCPTSSNEPWMQKIALKLVH
jgi:hypothetical protein